MIGISCSTAAALFWALAVILFKESGERMSPTALNLFKCLVSLFFFVPTLALAGLPLFPAGHGSRWFLFGLSGFLGITVADTLFFMALSRLGAGLTAVVDCLYLPFVITLSFFFLGERLSPAGLLGAALVVAAIWVGTAAGGSEKPRERKDLLWGIAFGVSAVFLIAASIVMVKGPLAETPVLWATFARLLPGTAGLAVLSLLHPRRKRIFAELTPSRTWAAALPASILGNYLAVLSWMAGMKHTLVCVAAILNQLSTVFIFLLATVVLKEPFTSRRLSATILAVAGAMLVAVAAP